MAIIRTRNRANAPLDRDRNNVGGHPVKELLQDLRLQEMLLQSGVARFKDYLFTLFMVCPHNQNKIDTYTSKMLQMPYIRCPQANLNK